MSEYGSRAGASEMLDQTLSANDITAQAVALALTSTIVCFRPRDSLGALLAPLRSAPGSVILRPPNLHASNAA
jgi:hypothetical protein